MRGRMETKIAEICQMEIHAREQIHKLDSNIDDAPEDMRMVSVIASSILTDDIETVVDMLWSLQRSLMNDNIEAAQ